jgi:hypothetical protein
VALGGCAVAGCILVAASSARPLRRCPLQCRRIVVPCCIGAPDGRVVALLRAQSRLILFGRSLGGAVVIHLAAQLEQARPT